MNRNIKAFVVVTSLMAAPLLPAGAAQTQTQPSPGQGQPTTNTPTTQGQGTTTQGQGTATQGQGTATQGQGTATQGQQGTTTQGQATPAPAPPPAATGQTLTPEQVGISLAAPQGWNPGDPKGFNVPGSICCAWSPDNVASIVVFVQNVGQPYSPRVLLEQSAQALEKGLGATVKTKEIRDVGGMRAFSLVVSGAGNGAAIDGKGTTPTTQHWIAIPRDKDIVIFLMTSPDTNYDTNEQAFQTVLSTLKVSGQQSAEQKAAS
jgi:hypothetical protein